MFDEVQCGLGRTGDWCGWKTLVDDVRPDAVSWARGIAGGFPLGAIWVSDRRDDSALRFARARLARLRLRQHVAG